MIDFIINYGVPVSRWWAAVSYNLLNGKNTSKEQITNFNLNNYDYHYEMKI